MQVIEKNKRLSQSCIWDIQKNYYVDKGIDAWSESVPFYITSNAFIANQYAKVIVSFISDWVAKNPKSLNKPFPILELGAGTGQLSYYLCLEIQNQLQARSLSAVKALYIVSDISKKNLDFIRKHPAMQDYVENNSVTFSCFDAVTDDTLLTYLGEGSEAEKIAIDNPLICIANYVYDSLPADVFYAQSGKIYESLLSIESSRENTENDLPIDWSQVKLKYENKPAQKDYYSDPKFNNVLLEYACEELDETYFIYPIGALNAFKNLNTIAHDKLVNLFSDKAFTTMNELSQQDQPELDVHGSFSLMVNLLALCQYTKQINGQYFLPTSRDGLTTAVMSCGVDIETMPNLMYELNSCFEEFNPTDYFNLYEHISNQEEHWQLPELVSMLTLSCWDPGLFSLIASRLTDLAESEETQVLDRLTSSLPTIAERFYYVPGCDDTLFDIASIYYALNYFQEALDLYEMSNVYFPEEYQTLYNIGLCYYYLEEYETAIDYLQQALAIDSSSNDCRSQIARAKKNLKKQ